MYTARPLITSLLLTLGVAYTLPAPTSPRSLVPRQLANPLEKCGVECYWDERDDPSLPVCHWDQCMAKVEETHCSIPEVTDVNANSPERRWEVSLAQYLWENMTLTWRNEENKNLPFVPYLSNLIHFKENMRCGVLTEHNGCNSFAQCDETKYPAGHFIINSLVVINNMLRNFYQGLNVAEKDIKNSLSSLGSTFAPSAEAGLTPAIIIDIVLLSYTSAAAPFWNAAAKRLPWFRQRIPGSTDQWKEINKNTHGTMKDLINGLVTGSLTLARDLTKAEAEKATDQQLNTLVSVMIKSMQLTTDAVATQIFNGEDTTRPFLYRWLNEGKFMTNADIISDEDISRMVQKPIYLQLISRAWKMSNLPIGAFIIKTGENCDGDTISKRIGGADERMRNTNGVCVDGKFYVLAAAMEPEKNCYWDGDYTTCPDDFKDVPGWGQLDGSGWAGLTTRDFARHAVATWKTNGEKNVGSIDVDAEIDGIEIHSRYDESNDIIDKIMTDGVAAPGLVFLPVCGFDEAWRNWVHGYSKFNFHPWTNWPCNE